MNPQLQQLKDIHLPKAITAWPIAPGWIILYASLLVLLAYVIYAIYLRKKKRRAINFALARLNKLEGHLSENPHNMNIPAEISTLIRRTALCYYQRNNIASLSGSEWLNFLNDSGNTTQFTELGSLLIDAPYRRDSRDDLLPLFAVTRNWLITVAKKHKLTAEK